MSSCTRVTHAAAALSLLLLSAVPHSANAQATVINFAANACTGTGNSGQGYNSYNTYTTQGFRFIGSPASVFATPCAGDATYTGTTTLYPNNVGNISTLTQVSGNPFSITSIDLATLLVFGQPQVLTFTGTKTGGALVTQSFTIPGQSSGAPALATYTFQPTFSDLTSLLFSAQLQPYYQFTNLRLVAAVPEPGIWALLGAGLFGVMTAVRRRQ